MTAIAKAAAAMVAFIEAIQPCPVCDCHGTHDQAFPCAALVAAVRRRRRRRAA